MKKAGLFCGLVFFGGLLFASMMQKQVHTGVVYTVGMAVGALYIALLIHFEDRQ